MSKDINIHWCGPNVPLGFQTWVTCTLVQGTLVAAAQNPNVRGDSETTLRVQEEGDQ